MSATALLAGAAVLAPRFPVTAVFMAYAAGVGTTLSSRSNEPDPIDQSFVVDIETAPLSDASRYVDDDLQPPKNYKKPDSIAAWKQEARLKQIERAALDPDLCRVVAIGLWPEGDAIESTVARSADEERVMIEALWRRVAMGHLIGYNIIGFDLPVLVRRSMYLGIDKVPAFRLSKYRPSANVTDLMVSLTMEGTITARSLKWYARRIGLQPPNNPIEGRDIPNLVEAGQWDLVRQHVEDDVRVTGELATFLNTPKYLNPRFKLA